MSLWRRLRTRIGQPSPAERLVDACRRLRDEPELLAHPPRLSLFGLTRLPASYLDVLEAIGAGRDVHLFLLHPSPALWERLEPVVGPRSRHLLRSEDPTAGAARHPLLQSWGRDAREMQLVLGSAVPHGEGYTETARPEAPTLLQQLQDDIRADRLPAGSAGGDVDRRPLLDSDDDSIRVHSCHGRGRQVEVLRDAILHLLEDDPTLGAPRHHRDVSRHRDLCAVDSGDLRRARAGGRIDRPGAHARRSDWPTVRCARPTR